MIRFQSKKYLLGLLVSTFSSTLYAQNPLPLDQLQMPPGFHIEIFAEGIKDARKLALGDNGTVFVGSTDASKVYAIVPNNNSPHGHEVKVIASGLYQPQGVAFFQGNLYVAEADRIIRYDNIEQRLNNPPSPFLVNNNFPLTKTQGEERYQRHGWKSLRVGPDHKLYVAIGAPCDSCLPKNKLDGTIVRMDRDGENLEIYAKGVRNSVGFDWDPINQKFWFTDNGRDKMGDEIPPDKLCYAPVSGLDFGFPYYHGKNKNGKHIPDPEFGKLKSAKGITWPAMNLPAHVAVLGMTFYTGNMFPAKYKNQIIIAEHGSWDRSTKIGYRLSLVKIKNNKALSYTPFITGWEKNEKNWGRPVEPLVMPDGSLLISDDYAGVIYRITYSTRKNGT